MSGSTLGATIYSWLSLAVNFVIPFSTLLTMNVKIIVAMKSHSKHMAKQAKKPTPDAKDGDTSSGVAKKNSRDQQVTMMLIGITLGLFVLTIPQYIRYVVFKFIDPYSSAEMFADFTLTYHLTAKLLATNSAVNFFLYCLTGSKFRKEALGVLSCKTSHVGRFTGSSSRSNKIYPTV